MCSRCVRTSVGARIPGKYVQQQVQTYISWQFFFFNIRACVNSWYMQYVHQQVQYLRTECRRSRYLSSLQQYRFINIYTYVYQQCSTCVQQYVVRTAWQQVQRVRVQEVQWQVQQARKYSNRYISRCSTCVSTAAVGTAVVLGGTCVTSLQRSGNDIDYEELNISLLTSIVQLHQLLRVRRPI